MRTTTKDASTPTDGRHARSDRSRTAIAEALLALVNEGNIRPTAEQIATRAGVSIRSVFRHTADAEQLNEILVEMHISRTSELFDLPPLPDDRAGRIEGFVAHRRRLYEAITPVRRAVRVHGPFGEVLRNRVEEVNDLLRHQIPEAFARELAAVDATAGGMLRHELELATSWSSWDHLRCDQGLDPDASARVIADMLDSLLP